MSARALPSPLPASPAIQTPAVRPVPAAPPPARQVNTRGRAVWLAIHLRGWQLHAALAGRSDTQREIWRAQPIAVVEPDRRGTLVACNEIAHARGVRSGHSLNAAIALCPQMQLLSRDLNSEASLLEKLATHCERYTSTVSVEAPNELLLEIRGSIKLFGGLAALIETVQSDLSRLGMTPQIAVAPTAQAGLWLARAASNPIIVRPRDLHLRLGRLPVSFLSWPADIELRLARFGVLTIGDLLRLPRAGLSRRIGHTRLAELDYALGRHPEVRNRHSSTESYSDRVLLDFEIETTGLLSVLIESRFKRLNRFLTRRALATDQVCIELQHRDRSATPVVIGLACPTSDTAHIAKLMHEHLAKLILPAPVAELVIRLDRLYSLTATSRELFGRQLLASVNASTEGQARLLEQLTSRLGSDAVQQISLQSDYRPEFANRLEPASASDRTKTADIPPWLAPRPLWLLKSSRPIRARRSQLLEGAEIIEAGWWDGSCAKREYFRLHSARGALAWVFREDADARTFIHGLFG
jgi:protein ImuB